MPADPPKFIPAASPEAKKLDNLHALMREMRGTSIDQAIWLDVLVTDILTDFFCADLDRRAYGL